MKTPINWWDIRWRDVPLPRAVMELPSYLGGSERWRHDTQGGTQAERSSAISLKRIADTLDEIKEFITSEQRT